MLMAGTSDTRLYRADQGFDFAGNNFTMIVGEKRINPRW